MTTRTTKFSRGDFVAGLAASLMLSNCAADTAQPVPVDHSNTPAFVPQDENVANQIQRIIQYYVEQNAYAGKVNIGIVAGAISPRLGKARLFFAGNPVKARHHREGLVLNGDTPFEIGSITKVFNSCVFGHREKSYTRTIGDYVKLRLPAGIRELKIDDIATYSSGFPTDDKPPNWWEAWVEHGDRGSLSLRDLVTALHGKLLPQCAPGTRYSYSNFAWGLMGLAATGISDENGDPSKAWASAIKELNEYIGLSTKTVPATSATAYEIPAGYSGNDLLPESYNYLENAWTTLGGFGDLVSTGNDMMTWLAYNMGIGGRDLPLLKLQQAPRATWSEEEPPQPPPSYPSNEFPCPKSNPLSPPVVTARGWFIDDDLKRKLVVKNGDVPGFGSWMGFKPWVATGRPSAVGAFVLTNNYPTNANQLGNDIMSTLLS